MDGVKHIFGLLLLGMAIYFILPLLPKDIGGYLLPVFMIGSAIYLLFFDKVGNDIRGFRIVKILFSVVILAVSVYAVIPQEKLAPAWQSYSDDLYQNALDNNQKIMIDFYADWCIPCKEYDALTFTDERVISLSKEFVNIKVDMTKTLSDETEKLRNKFNIVGMPTILFFNSNGEEVERLSGFLNADEFLKIMSNIK
jgi:thiol:disulfide interchange protein DsbD